MSSANRKTLIGCEGLLEEPNRRLTSLVSGLHSQAAGPPMPGGASAAAAANGSTVEEDSGEGGATSTFERLSRELQSSATVQKEVALGQRVGFYKLHGLLGTGNFSQVKLGTHELIKEKVAVKILDKTKLDAKTQRLLSREVTVMERLQHPSVISLFEVIESVAKLHLVMEFAPGGELFTRIRREGRMAEGLARHIFAQVATAVAHMHSRHVVHRDLKAENVFFAGPRRIKVGDFGFSTLAKPGQELHTFCGSPPYAAPELFRREAAFTYRGQPVDTWALGVLLFFMLAGTLPFRAATLSRLRQLVLDGDFRLPAFVSQPARELVTALLHPDPDSRPEAAELARSGWLLAGRAAKRPPEEQEELWAERREERRRRRREAEARRRLGQLGIDERSLDEAAGSVRSPIGGAFRIAAHRSCGKDSDKDKDKEKDNEEDDEEDFDDGDDRRHQRSADNGSSKACALL